MSFAKFRHYPIGLLYDMHVADGTLPWIINIRTKVVDEILNIVKI